MNLFFKIKDRLSLFVSLQYYIAMVNNSGTKFDANIIVDIIRYKLKKCSLKSIEIEYRTIIKCFYFFFS